MSVSRVIFLAVASVGILLNAVGLVMFLTHRTVPPAIRIGSLAAVIYVAVSLTIELNRENRAKRDRQGS